MTLFERFYDTKKTAVKTPVSVKVSVLRMDGAALKNTQPDILQNNLVELA